MWIRSVWLVRKWRNKEGKNEILNPIFMLLFIILLKLLYDLLVHLFI